MVAEAGENVSKLVQEELKLGFKTNLVEHGMMECRSDANQECPVLMLHAIFLLCVLIPGRAVLSTDVDTTSQVAI